MCYSCNGVDVCFLIKQIVYTCLRKGAKLIFTFVLLVWQW